MSKACMVLHIALLQRLPRGNDMLERTSSNKSGFSFISSSASLLEDLYSVSFIHLCENGRFVREHDDIHEEILGT